jgi:hypothetical protein
MRPRTSSAHSALIEQRSNSSALEVLARETKRETNGWTAFSGQRQNKSSLSVRLTAGEFETEFGGESGSKGLMKGYGDAAGKVVKQVESWVKSNYDRRRSNDDASAA